MSVTIIVEIAAKPGKRATLIEQLAPMMPETRAQPGCRSMEIYSAQDCPNTMVAIEEWDDRPSYDAYLNWRIETGMMADIMQLAEGGPTIRFFDENAT